MRKKSYGKAHRKYDTASSDRKMWGTLHLQSLVIQLLQTIMQSKLDEKCSFTQR